MTTARAAEAKPAKLTLRERSDITQQRILDTAVDVLAEYGFHRFRLKEVARRSELTEAGVLHHFPSKEALLHAVLAYREQASDEVVQRLQGLTGKEAFRTYPLVAERIVAEPRRLQLYLLLEAEGLTPGSTTLDYFARRNEQTRARVIEHVVGGQRAGEFRPDADPERYAREVVAFMDGIGLQWLTEGRSFDLVAAWTEYFDDLIIRLSRRSERPAPRGKSSP
jgi:AcrR family transcriptional regulator